MGCHISGITVRVVVTKIQLTFYLAFNKNPTPSIQKLSTAQWAIIVNFPPSSLKFPQINLIQKHTIFISSLFFLMWRLESKRWWPFRFFLGKILFRDFLLKHYLWNFTEKTKFCVFPSGFLHHDKIINNLLVWSWLI